MYIHRLKLQLLAASTLMLCALPFSHADSRSESENSPLENCNRTARPALPRETPPLMHLRRIHLTEEQQDKVFNILHAQMPAAREKMQSAIKARADMQALVMSGNYDESKARAIAESGARAMADLEQIRASSDSRILALLTHEQRKGLDERRPPGPMPGWRPEFAPPEFGPPQFGPRPH